MLARQNIGATFHTILSLLKLVGKATWCWNSMIRSQPWHFLLFISVLWMVGQMVTVKILDWTSSWCFCGHTIKSGLSLFVPTLVLKKEVDLVTYIATQVSIFVPTDLPNQSADDDAASGCSEVQILHAPVPCLAFTKRTSLYEYNTSAAVKRFLNSSVWLYQTFPFIIGCSFHLQFFLEFSWHVSGDTQTLWFISWHEY
jgi:hypothetical protein